MVTGCSPKSQNAMPMTKALPPKSVVSHSNAKIPSDALDDFKSLLFADQSLENIAADFKVQTKPEKKDFSHFFALALANKRHGHINEAKINLKRVLSLPHIESRVRLWTWKALKDLKENPPPNSLEQVHGVVIEMPMGTNGLDTLAVYSDGTLRYINYTGKIMVWDAPDNRLSPLVNNLLTAAKPLVAQTPALEKHRNVKNGDVQVSVLTLGGIYQAHDEANLNEGSAIYPVIVAGSQIIPALVQLQGVIQ